MRGHEGLDVWHRSIELVVVCYEIAKKLPPSERFHLVSQLRRAVTSIPTNVAEGHGRTGRKEYAHHVSIARGSVAEVETLLTIIERVGYLAAEQLRQAREECTRVGGMLSRLRDALKRPPRRS